MLILYISSFFVEAWLDDDHAYVCTHKHAHTWLGLKKISLLV